MIVIKYYAVGINRDARIKETLSRFIDFRAINPVSVPAEINDKKIYLPDKKKEQPAK